MRQTKVKIVSVLSINTIYKFSRSMINIFSFSIYGTADKYYRGLKDNINLIKTHFPSYYIYIYYGQPCEERWLEEYKVLSDKVVLIPTNKSGLINTLERYRVLCNDDIDLVFVRDANSEVNERDRWCINRFLESSYTAHTIRDHYYHKQKLTGGLTGFKIHSLVNKNAIKQELDSILSKKPSQETEEKKYGDDEIWLETYLYPLIKDQLLVHTSINAYNGDKYEKIQYENTGTNFAGNVYEYTSEGKVPKFNYHEFSMEEQIKWLVAQRQYDLIIELTKDLPYDKITYMVADSIFFANYYTDNVEGCINAVKLFEFMSLTHFNISNCDFLFRMLQSKGKQIIATTNVKYEPKKDEIAVYYGCFPISHRMFPISNKVYRNAYYFNRIQHSTVQCDPCWDNIDQIYILNLEIRHDRYIETLGELCKLGAPLNKVYHYKANKESCGPYTGATKNHLDAMDHMIANKFNTCLILEDDIVFNSDVDTIKEDLKTFMERKYDYDICFLSYSKYHSRRKKDDLLLISKQLCTTSSAYLLNSETVGKVRDCVFEGYTKLQNGGSPNIYCIDRYWEKLQNDDKIFLFKRKIAYQRPNYSNIRNEVIAHLD